MSFQSEISFWMLGFQSTCTSQQVSKLFFSWCQSSYPVKLIFAWIWGIFGLTNINYCTSYLKKSHPPYKTSILTTVSSSMQEKLIQWYFKPELSLELNSSLSLQTIGQNVLPSKKLSGQNLYLSRHCPLTSHYIELCSMYQSWYV